MNESYPTDDFQEDLFERFQSWLEDAKREGEETKQTQGKAGILEQLDFRLATFDARIEALNDRLAVLGARIDGVYAQLAHLTDPYTAPERMAVLPPGVREITE